MGLMVLGVCLAARSNEMFPIAMVGNDMKRGWIFSIYKGRPFCRLCYTMTSKGTVTSTSFGGLVDTVPTTALPSLYDGRWHQVIMTYVDATSQSCIRTYIDSCYVGAQRISDFGGIYYGEEGDVVPFVIGAHPYQNNRTYMGEIAELRIVDHQIPHNWSCRVAVPPGPVDQDTAVMLQFGENADKFGFDRNYFYTFNCDNSTWHYIARNWNLHNAATNNVLQPRWYSYDTFAENGMITSETVDGAPGATIRSDDTAAAAFADGKSLSFIPSNGKSHVINIPGGSMLSTNDFTIEIFYKTTNGTGSDTQTILCSDSSFLAKLCVYNNRLLLRVTKTDGTTPGDINSVLGAADGNWHHAAIVYHQDTKLVRLYSDYMLAGQREAELRSAAGTFIVGGVNRTSQIFNGQIDNLRITRRALQAGEFLSARPFVSSKCFDASFDTPDHPWASGIDSSLIADGVPTVVGEGQQPTLVKSHSGWVLDGENGPRIREGGQAVYLDNSYVFWDQTPTMERNAMTFEFFARLKSCKGTGDTFLFGASYGNLPQNAGNCKVLYRRADANGSKDRAAEGAASPSARMAMASRRPTTTCASRQVSCRSRRCSISHRRRGSRCSSSKQG